MEEDLVTRLVAAATPAGASVSWFGRGRADSLPATVLSVVSPGEEWTHEGPDGLDRARVRFDHYDTTDTGVLTLARAAKAEMRAEKAVGSTIFHPAMLDAERWLDASEEDGGTPLFRIQQEFLFYHEET